MVTDKVTDIKKAIEDFEWAIHADNRSDISLRDMQLAIAALMEQCVRDATKTSDWISVGEAMPDQFVSVLGYMTDAGEFPPVRECYLVGGAFFFPALRDIHPVSHWMPMPTKEEV